MKDRVIKRRVKRVKKARGNDGRQHTRFASDVAKMFDDLYSQLDLQLTRMAQIQLQFDVLRAKIRLM
jgi:hypothetical protein